MQSDRDVANPVENTGPPPLSQGARSWARWAILAAVPLLLVLVIYTRPGFRGGPPLYFRLERPEEWRLGADFDFYVYQLTQSCEAGGRWWEVADDPLMGRPYQTEVARSPALFEGVDLMLISAVTGRYLDPVLNAHLMIALVLASSGWVAGWMVWRLTRSCYWAVLAQVLITLHCEPLGRAEGHLHLFKYGWVLLAVWAFSRFLDLPSLGRGVLAGLAAALVLQSSFYFGFFLTVALGCWWVGCLAAGRLDRRHLVASGAAAITFTVVGAALTFPVWAVSRKLLLNDSFFDRSPYEVWRFGAELWQYFMPKPWILKGLGDELRGRGIFPWEGSSLFPGFTLLLAIAIYALARLRGRQLCTTDPWILDRIMGLIALLVVLSLRGGPAVFLYELIGSFRCYARAGALAWALACVAGPVILCSASRRVRPKVLGAALAMGITALAGCEVYLTTTAFAWMLARDEPPAWSRWLAAQPSEVRLAAFAPLDSTYPLYSWGTANAFPRVRHKHATLNGCDFGLLEADLRLLGASYQNMNQDGLRFIVSLGYGTLAFHRDYLDAHPWIRSLPWLDPGDVLGDWLIYRVNSHMPRFPVQALERLLAEQPVSRTPEEVPPQRWITGGLDLAETVVVQRSSPVEIAWADAQGHLLTKPYPALYQHVFGPDLPAYTVRTPKQVGNYRLVILDSRRRPIAAKPYVVVPIVRTSRPVLGKTMPDHAISATVVNQETCDFDRVRVVLENASPYYLQAQAARDGAQGAACSHPGLAAPAEGSTVLSLSYLQGASTTRQVNLMLPHDLPAHGRLEMDVPIEWQNGSPRANRVRIAPGVSAAGQRTVEKGDVHVELVGRATPSVGEPALPRAAVHQPPSRLAQ
jgi:hypothetical protein